MIEGAGSEERGQAGAEGLAAFLRQRQEAILAEWEERVRQLPASQELDHPALIDSVPELLERIAELVEGIARGAAAPLPIATAEDHAEERLDAGFDLAEVVSEYSLLRNCILRQLEAWAPEFLGGLPSLNQAIDKAIAASVDRYTHARHRGLLAAERASREQSQRALALLDALLGALPVGLGFLDTELRFLRINEALAAINGLPPSAHLGRTVREVLPQLAPRIEPLLRRVIQTGEPVANLELQLAAPSSPAVLRWFLVNYFPVRPAGQGVQGVGAAVIDITDTKLAGADRDRLLGQLDSERRWLKAVLEQLPAGVSIAEAPAGKVVFSNRRAAEIAGPLVPARELSDYGLQQVLDPAGKQLPASQLPLARAVRGETVSGADLVLPRPGRPSVIITANAAPIRDAGGKVVGAVVAFDDVTERRHAEEVQRFLGEATRLFSESLDPEDTLRTLGGLAVPRISDWCSIELTEEGKRPAEPLVLVHADPARVELARTLMRLYPPDPAAPRGTSRVLRTGRSELYPELSDQLLASTARDPRQLALLRQLQLKSLMIVPLVARRKTLGVISFASAESGRRFGPEDLAMAEQLASRAGMALDNARLLVQANEATRLREKVLAVVSHDLKNPLGAIGLSTALLLKKLTEPHARKHLETIRRSAHRMDRLISDLLDVASIEAGRLSTEKQLHRAGALMLEALELNEPAATEHQVRLVREGELEELWLHCDRERVLQVFSNLLGNAVKFCRPQDTITVRAQREDEAVHFAIADTGPGIPGEELPHIFEPYWSAQRHARKGTGLGLFITRGIVEAHGGRIWADSKPGAGCTIHFTLPLARKS